MHQLGFDEREALFAAVEEQATKAKLLTPLLFKLPVKLGSKETPVLSYVYVHEQQEPRSLAESFVSRYLGWDDAEQATATIAAAIVAKAKELDEARERELQAESEKLLKGA